MDKNLYLSKSKKVEIIDNFRSSLYDVHDTMYQYKDEIKENPCIGMFIQHLGKLTQIYKNSIHYFSGHKPKVAESLHADLMDFGEGTKGVAINIEPGLQLVMM